MGDKITIWTLNKASNLLDKEQDMVELNDMMRRFPLVHYSVLDHFQKFKTENADTLEKLPKQ